MPDSPMMRSLTFGFFLLLAVYRVSLLGAGAFAWPDEHLYNDALKTVSAVLEGDIVGASNALTGFGARPAEATLRLLPAAIQVWLERRHGISVYDPQSLMIPAFFNVISSLLLSLVFYRLSRNLLGEDRRAALVAVVVFSLLTSSNVFIRHIIPYDTALMLCLLSLLLAFNCPPDESLTFHPKRVILSMLLATVGLVLYPISFLVSRTAALYGAGFWLVTTLLALWVSCRGEWRQTRNWVVVGLVAGFGLAVYPAYYPFPVAVGAVVVLSPSGASFLTELPGRLRAGLVYGLSVLSVMLSYELVARVGDVSYLACAYRLSKTITQGNFDEGYIFLAKYFSDVEGEVGWGLLLAAGGYWLILLWRVARRKQMLPGEYMLALCCSVFALLYLVFATQSTVLHRMTFTGRYARMYFPVVVLAAVGALCQIKKGMFRSCAFAALLLLSFLSFWIHSREYWSLAYPNDVLYSNGIRWEDVGTANKVYESERIPQEWVSTRSARSLVGGRSFLTRPGDERFTLLNFGFFTLEATQMPVYMPPANAAEIYRKPHFLGFRSSRYEGFAAAKRRQLADRKYQIAIFRSTEPQ